VSDFSAFTSNYDKSDPLKPCYFKIEVLERYFSNPQYQIYYTDYRGGITTREDVDIEYEHIQDFGLAYSKTDANKRVVVMFAEDLTNLPPKAQSYWYSYLLDNQDEYCPNEGFVKNLIYGEWVENISIFEALLMEEEYINKMCNAIGLPPMFNEDYSDSSSHLDRRPDGYRIILLPTRKNYYNFVSTLEKVTTSNINIKTFMTSASLVNAIVRVNNEGSVSLLGMWLESNVKSTEDIQEIIVAPLKKLVKIRQIPAHKIYDNAYDESIWGEQNILMNEVYTAFRDIRLLLATHPLASTVKVPRVLFDGEHIRSY
jgi:hypothetical protein